ncbi:hypothetical protein LCGC14_2285600 [marine sediment metagenome]|uniref:Lin1244/Lin1753-like N-terminal domain-containing protein n=1 Tax=marine sediment metagenome TaxID=412755 RepID=A0A0F9FN00_9ZZZZ
MKWYKHDSNANADAKLRKIRLKYGMEGYGLYWYCLELIAQNVEKHNLSFELEHDAEIIAADVGIHFELVQEMMVFMVDLGLFEQENGIITCLKLAKRTDEYTSKLIKQLDNVPTLSRQSPDKVRSNRTEEKRLEQNIPSPSEKALDEQIWKTGVSLLGDKKSDRSLIGKWVSEHGKEKVAAVIAQAVIARPVEPKAYITALLQDRTRPTDPYYAEIRKVVASAEH